MRGLATLPQGGSRSLQWSETGGRPKEDPLAVYCFCVCSGSLGCQNIGRYVIVLVLVLVLTKKSYLHHCYLHRRIAERACSRTLRSAAVPLLDKPSMRTDFSKRAFRFSAPTVWNSLPQTVLVSDSRPDFKSRLKTFSSIRLLLNTVRPAASASDCMAL